MDAAKRGTDALAAGKYADAIQEFTAAIKVSPTSPDYFIKRSTAYQRSSPADFKHAYSDAEKAVVFAQTRAKRELIIQAQLRRGIALFGLERYADAAYVFDVVKRMDPKEKTLPIWESKIATKMSALPEDHASRQVTIKETPDVTQSVEPAVDEQSSESEDEAQSSTAQPTPTVDAAIKYRQDWYQSNDTVTFALLAKGVPKEHAEVVIEPRSLVIIFPSGSIQAGDTEKNKYSVEPLYADVDPSQSSFKVMSTKIEVVLRTAQPGIKWHSLEARDGDVTSTQPSTLSSTSKPTAPSQAGPAYPTSSRTGPKNWDKLATDLTTKKKKDDSVKDGKIAKSADAEEDDYDYDAADNGGDEVNSFFQKLYSGADPDTRRAMMKSYSESNGTALSTNWEEVSKKTVETTPPTGMEAKKY